MASIAEILLAQGQNQADAIRQRADAWRPLIGQVAGLPAQIQADKRAEQVRQQQIAEQAQRAQIGQQTIALNQQRLDEGTAQAGAAKTAADRAARVREVFGSEGVIGADGTPNFERALEVAHQKGYDPLDIVNAANEVLTQHAELLKKQREGQPPPAKTREIRRRNADGSEAIDIVEDTPGQSFTSAAVPEKLTYLEAKPYIVDGKRTLVRQRSDGKFVDPAGNIVPNPQPDVPPSSAGAGSSIPGNWDVQGEDFLKSIPAQWRTTVKKIANYDEDPTKVASMRGGSRERIMQWVNQVNPSYDASMFSNRAPTRKAFTTGTQGQQITAINTAIEHLDLLQQASDALANGNFKPGNALYNRVQSLFGGAAPSNYDTIKEMVDHEVGAVASKGVPTVADVAAQNKLANNAASPAAVKGYINTLIPLMGSKLNALHYQYQQAMGPNDSWKPLTPTAEAILQTRGVPIGATPESTDTRNQTQSSMPKEGTEGKVNGTPAVWKTVNGKAGWYAK